MSVKETAPATRLSLGFAGLASTPDLHLSVDGMTPSGPNLSHWPGNRTPEAFKADLSTGICMNFARADHDLQREFLAGADTVLNDHYDTDGFGSLLAILRPEVAEAHEGPLLAAAATGDFGVFQSEAGFAIDRIVANLAAEHSPVAGEFSTSNGPEKSFLRYRWLIEHAEAVLGNRAEFSCLFEDELASVTQAIDKGRQGAVRRNHHEAIGMATISSSGDLHRMALNTLAATYRVLHIQRDDDGCRFRYHDRTESWFELQTIHPLPRRDLRRLAGRLAELEPEHDGACWLADAPTEPIPELYFGVPSTQEYGRVTRILAPSQLSPELVEREFASYFNTAESL